MKLYYENNNFKLYEGKMEEVLPTLPENSVDCIITDPPYELNFMNKGWDNSGIAFQKSTWEHCLRVLKPGGYLLAFGGSRTFHRIACAIEDAGFEIRDTLFWLYGSGFPKGQNIGLAIDKKMGVESEVVGFDKEKADKFKKSLENQHNGYDRPWMHKEDAYLKKGTIKKAQNEWNGWNTNLKPAYEPIIMARKPFKGSLVDNILEYGVGGINIDECRVETDELKGLKMTMPDLADAGKNNKNAGSINKCGYNIVGTDKRLGYVGNEIGRYPANILHDGSQEVMDIFPDTKSGNISKEYKQDTRFNINEEGKGGNLDFSNCYGDSGNASRYFYCAKASKKDRDEGLDAFEDKKFTSALNTKNGSGERLDGGATPIRKNIHPTVKPMELMQYLIRLVAPKNAIILDPFNGSGSTGKAAMFENRERDANYYYIGIEMTPEYLPISQARIDYALNKYEYDKIKDKQENKKTGQLSIFDIM